MRRWRNALRIWAGDWRAVWVGREHWRRARDEVSKSPYLAESIRTLAARVWLPLHGLVCIVYRVYGPYGYWVAASRGAIGPDNDAHHTPIDTMSLRLDSPISSNSSPLS